MEQNAENSNFKRTRQLILNAKEPLVMKNQINSSLISWDLKDWDKVIGNYLLHFRCGKNIYTEEPQWERTCPMKEATFKEFLEYTNSDDDSRDDWWYFDYKYLCDWFTDKDALKQRIDWSSLGFPEIGSDDSTFWMGSKGAHTSCHKDTYGCNIVLQVFGRKQWILFPPEQNLKPTRIPFEESSIYSKLNFFSPNVEHFKGIGHCHKVILNPGEVLVVPNKWWHYVENLETAISVNAWLPLPQDAFQRIKESVATIFVRKMIEDRDGFEDIVLNPNMQEEMASCDLAFSVIEDTKAKLKKNHKVQRTTQKLAQNKSEDLSIKPTLGECEDIHEVPVLTETELKDFLISQSGRFQSSKQSSVSTKKNEAFKKITDFLEVITDDEVLDLVAKKIIDKI